MAFFSRRPLSTLGGVLLLTPLLVLVLKAVEKSPFEHFIQNSIWLEAFLTSGLLLVGAALLSILLSVPLAWILYATDVPGKRFFSVLVVLPLAFPSYVGGYLVVSAFSPGGLISWFDPYSILGALCALSFTFPLAYLSVRSSLNQIDQTQWNAARSLGLSAWQAFWKVVWPQIKAGVFSGGLWVGLYALGDFGAVSLTRTKTLSYMVYLRYKSLVEKNEAIGFALLLLALSLFVCWLSFKFAPQKNKDLRLSKKRWTPLSLGKHRWWVFGFLVCVVGIWLVAPCGVLLSWMSRGHKLGATFAMPWAETFRTLGVGIAGAVLIALFSMVMISEGFGHTMKKKDGNISIRLISTLGYSLPGIVIGITCASAALRWIPFAYQTVGLLLAGLFIRFSPLALDTLSQAFKKQNASSYWAARSLGCGRLSALAKVVLPTMKGSVFVAFLALFIAIVKELPVTMMIAPPGFTTLSLKIWSLTEDAYLAEVAPVVFLMVLFTLGLLWLQNRIERPG